MHPYIKSMARVFEQNKNPARARQMARYMRDQFAFLGIRTPARRALLKPFLSPDSLPDPDELPDVIKELWLLPEREYQMAALDILAKVKRKLMPHHLPLLEWMIVTKSWWDTVDGIAANLAGSLFLAYPEWIPEYADRWLESDNIWLNRSAILFQLHNKSQTDESRLFRSILRHADSDEFFIQKASGWALREYSKTTPAAVARFIAQHDLKPLCRREGLKWINRAKKDEKKGFK